MKRYKSPPAQYAIYIAVRLVVAVAQALTIEQCYAFAGFLAAIMYRVDKRHRMVAHDNLRHAFGDLYDEAERDRIVRGVYLHFCCMLMEMLQIPRKFHLTNWRERIVLDGHAHALERLLRGDSGTGSIFLTGHFGNWEMAGYLFGVFGFPPHSVARALDNPHLDRFLRRFRERTGQKMIDKNGGYEQMLEVLRSGGVLSMLADQDAGERGCFVEFFGRPASTHKAIALLAIEYNAPIYVGFARRVGPGFRYEVGSQDVIVPADWADQADPVRYVTQRYTSALEAAIRLAPEQYLWLHRRWKHQPKVRARKPERTPGSEAIPGPNAQSSPAAKEA